MDYVADSLFQPRVDLNDLVGFFEVEDKVVQVGKNQTNWKF